MLQGETIRSGAPDTCEDCGVKLVEQVLRSNAGYYIGTACHCGPYSRESDYFPTYELAEKMMKSLSGEGYRTTDFNPSGLTVIDLEPPKRKGEP